MKRESTNSRTRRSMHRNGFTLMELMIVMAIITVLMLLAIPTVSALKKSGNRLSAIKSIQAIQTAQSMYSQIYGTSGYACTLPALGGDPTTGAPSATSAQLLKADITSGYKDGYVFTIACTATPHASVPISPSRRYLSAIRRQPVSIPFSPAMARHPSESRPERKIPRLNFFPCRRSSVNIRSSLLSSC